MGANIDRRITESIVIKFNGCVCSLKEFQQQTLHMYIIFTLFFILRKLASACQSAAKGSNPHRASTGSSEFTLCAGAFLDLSTVS